MLSVAPAARSSFAGPCTDHDLLFSDPEFASWDLHDLIFDPVPETKPISAQSNKNVVNSPETNQNSLGSIESMSGSVYSTEPGNETLGFDIHDRKLKRMKSNRESARRSRMRKQRHVDNLRNQANRFTSLNRELSNRLRFILHNGLIVRSENQRLQTEHTLLRHRLIELQNLMIFERIQQMHNNNNNNIASNYFGTREYGQNLTNESMYLIA